jgi:hypothetical protein
MIEKILRLDQMVRIKRLATEQPNYADRAFQGIGSAPVSNDYILVPKSGIGSTQNGISILKQEFHLDEDPLAGFAFGQNQVYPSRQVAESVLADLSRETPAMD